MKRNFFNAFNCPDSRHHFQKEESVLKGLRLLLKLQFFNLPGSPYPRPDLDLIALDDVETMFFRKFIPVHT